MSKYHVALSFAGEDRVYVEAVATELRAHNVDVFYDKFEETRLWGKNVYRELSDIYRNRALYTVVFVSEAFRDERWTNHEIESAQARAFSENQDCVLPAIFDKSVTIPGLLDTTGHVSLSGLSPQDFARLIVKKLTEEGVLLSPDNKITYSQDAKADAGFPMSRQSAVTEIVTALKSYDWYEQKPAIDKIFELDTLSLNSDELFVLGRNIYQCACGGERKAIYILENLLREFAKLPLLSAQHLLNGMFYEVYFDSKGTFRGRELKSRRIDDLFAMQTVEKYADCVLFIRRALEPYRNELAVLPDTSPEVVEIEIRVSRKDPPVIEDIVFSGKSILVAAEADPASYSAMWKLSHKEFLISSLKENLSRAWNLPSGVLHLRCNETTDDTTKFRLPDGMTIRQPGR